MDTNNRAPKIPVGIRLIDGEEIFGEISGGVSRNIESALNTDKRFIRVDCEDGTARHVALDHIVHVQPQVDVNAPTLAKPRSATRENAQPLLGLSGNFSDVDLREAYHRLVKIYHPDRFAQTQLPREVIDYAGEMFRQINNAHQVLKRQLEFKKKFGDAA